jgi:dynein heavy chain
MRRHVYVTPKSYLSFIAIYKTVYTKEFAKIDVEERNIRNGLEKLAEASESIAALVVVAQKEDAELKEASAATDKLLFTLNIESKKAKEKSDQVNETTIKLSKDKDIVMADKAAAEEDLANALPFLHQAQAAVDSIQAKDVNEMAGMAKPSDITRIVMDAIQILFQKRLDLPNKVKTFTLAKKDITFVGDSYATETIGTLKGGLIAKIIDFSATERDSITEETVELLEPYLAVCFDGTDEKVFTKKWAAYGSSALVGMAVWSAAMVDYYKASKIVNPKLKFLEVKLAELREAEQKLKEAEAELQEVEALKANLKKQFDASMKEKNELEEKAAKTKKKMD